MIEDDRVPYLFLITMDKNTVITAITPDVEALGAYIVEVSVSAGNEIEIVLEKDEGSITWDDCSAVDKAFHEKFSQDEEDYALTVSSAGLDRPFRVLRQYRKALGTQVVVKFKGGKKLVATLSAADEESVTLSYTALEAVEGKKKKEKVAHEDRFPLAEINSVTPYIEMK